MDYDQSVQNREVDLFTTGAGTNEDNVNTVASENNLDLSNQSAQWGNSQSKEDYRHLGNTSIKNAEYPNDTIDSISSNTTANPDNTLQQTDPNELGQIVPTMPPGYTDESPINPESQLEKETQNKNLNDPLTAQRIIEEQEVKLSQDGNIFAFSEAIAKMRLEANSEGKENA